ncbi:MAG: ATP-dependent metallopeptidase FtsH/Yme1/Tma family protein [Proteobacteria bacterium]|jgi:cell division protease FtsH|nr:ATP-dependent metallopeptidase FtsH/Yme1/Tma family protein [Pseudomonadota bacterium]
MNNFLRNLIVWSMLGFGLVFLFNSIEDANSSRRAQISYSEFRQDVLSDNIAEVTYKGDQMTIHGQRLDGSRFETLHPIYKRDEDLENALESNRVVVNYENVEQPSLWSQLLVGAFPIILLLAIFFFFMRQMQGGISGKGGPMSFGRSKAKLMEGGKVKTTFKDVAGCEEAKEDVAELVSFLQDPTKFQKLGGKIPRGVLMVGPPGTGKTLLARAVAGEAKVPFFSISGSDFVEMFVGVGASRVRDMFEQAQKNAPCIVFIDEIDAVGRHRGAGLGGGHDEREQTLNQLLVEMDGFEGNDGIIIIAATNRPDVLDPALLRPGRFDRQVIVDLPDLNGREKILKVHLKKVPLSSDVDPKIIARGTPGFSGADLANLVNEAALFAARQGDKKVEQEHIDLARDKVMMGPERKSMIMTDEQKRITAYHESGHAIVGKLMPEHDPVYKVTIIPRGRALGVTMFLPEEDKYMQSKRYLLGRISALFGGRLAEEIINGEDSITTGASNDIEVATNIATNMVTKWGMSSLGPLKFGEDETNPFLGRSAAIQHQTVGDATSNKIDLEIKAIIDNCYNEAKRLLETNLDKLHMMAEALLNYETIDADQIDDIMAGAKPRAPKDWDQDQESKTASKTDPAIKGTAEET